MGAVGATFGRNLQPDYRPDPFNAPNPVTVSQQLLTREQFHARPSLNLLAAAWIQFQVHDWVNHARHPLGVDDVVVPMPGGLTWTNTAGGRPENLMRIAGNKAVPATPTARSGSSPTPPRTGGTRSEVYGSDAAKARRCATARRSG